MSKNITLFDVNQYFESCKLFGKPSPIVGNYEVRISTVLLWYVMRLSVLIRGEAGSAKSRISQNVVRLCFGQDGLEGDHPRLFLIDSGSDKANLDKKTEVKINASTHCYIPELQNVKNYFATIKKWSENPPMPHIYRRYNEECPYALQPLPLLTNLADSNEELSELGPELERRLISLTTICNADTNEKVHTGKARARYLPEELLEPLNPDRIKELQTHIQTLHTRRNGRRVINPYAGHIRKILSHQQTISNTVVDYLFDLIEAITVFNMEQRPSTEKHIFSLLEDNIQAKIIAGDMLNYMSVGINIMGPEILNIIPQSDNYGSIEVAPQSNERIHINEIVDRLTTVGYSRSKITIDRIMNKLVNSNFVKKDKDGKFYKTFTGKEWEKKINIDVLMEEPIEIIREHYPPEIYKVYKSQNDTILNPINGKIEEVKSKRVIEEVLTPPKLQKEMSKTESIQQALKDLNN